VSYGFGDLGRRQASRISAWEAWRALGFEDLRLEGARFRGFGFGRLGGS